MAEEGSSCPEKASQDLIFHAVLKMTQLNVTLQEPCPFVVSWICEGPTKRSCDIVGCAPPQPLNINTITNTYASLAGGLCCLIPQEIAAPSKPCTISPVPNGAKATQSVSL